jgi:hypothetical protein
LADLEAKLFAAQQAAAAAETERQAQDLERRKRLEKGATAGGSEGFGAVFSGAALLASCRSPNAASRAACRCPCSAASAALRASGEALAAAVNPLARAALPMASRRSATLPVGSYRWSTMATLSTFFKACIARSAKYPIATKYAERMVVVVKTSHLQR